MENNDVKVPLLRERSSEVLNGVFGDESAATIGGNAEERPPLLSTPSDKWKFKFHRLLSGKVFNDAHDLSQGQREYRRKQRETLARFREVDSMSRGSTAEATPHGEEEPHETLAMNISFVTNLFLFIIKELVKLLPTRWSMEHMWTSFLVIAAVKSGSLAIVASALDSFLDLLAGAILWFTKWTMQRQNVYKYPIGTGRLQPVGIVVFAAIMATLGMQVLLTAVQQLVEGSEGHKMVDREKIWLIVIMGIVISSKLCLYLYCCTFKSDIVQAYAMDHRLDVLTNSVGLAAALLADRFYWWIDPLGAMLLALYTVFNWFKTVIENAASLVGQAAPPEFLQLVTYMAFNHHPKIRRLDTVRAYMLGGLYFVEVDLELPEEMGLREAHNIGETLQNKLEGLPEVERAYVHLDFESSHRPEHHGGSYDVLV